MPTTTQNYRKGRYRRQHRIVEDVHISKIQPGDYVIFHGCECEVREEHLEWDSFMGKRVFGDSYWGGRKPVTRVRYLDTYHDTLEEAWPEEYKKDKHK